MQPYEMNGLCRIAAKKETSGSCVVQEREDQSKVIRPKEKIMKQIKPTSDLEISTETIARDV
jgi:hypothetical protein